MKSLNKRQKIIAVSLVLTLGLLCTQLVPYYLSYRFILGLGLISLALSAWALWEGMKLSKALVLLTLPTLFTLAVAAYYFLLPVRWLTRLPVALSFGIAYYCLLLSQNVFSISAIRTIPLYRAASTVAFLFTLITAFLLFNVLLSFGMLFSWNGGGIFLISLPLILQTLWSIEMEKIDSVLLFTAIFLSLMLAEVGIAISFWPIAGPMASLVLATFMYVILGVITHKFRDRLNREAVMEYVSVGAVVFLVALFTTSWAG